MYLLFPGRHHLLTNFQLEYLTLVTSADPAKLRDVNGEPLGLTEPVQAILWAVTSANHNNTRRNPLPGHRREAAIEAFAGQLDVPSFVFPIDDVGTSVRFAEYVIKKIEVDSGGQFRLTPANTVVACSTPEVIELYEGLGFRILPAELTDRRQVKFASDPPWALLNHLAEVAAAGGDWRSDERFLTKVARATQRLFVKYRFGDRLGELFRDPVLTGDGDLTATRDYNTYVRSFDDGADRKYALIKDFVRPGRIVDVGCCTGALLRKLTFDDRLRESDFYGVELARPLYNECIHRKEQGAFGNDNVFFYQRNVATEAIFPPNSVKTFLTFALTHELESYQGRAFLLRFLNLLYQQTAPRGRWLNVDVVGPENGDQPVYLDLNRDDGWSPTHMDPAEPDVDRSDRQSFCNYLKGLSTFARFLQFANDFRKPEGFHLPYKLEEHAGKTLVALSLRNACEFLSKKDYTDNWQSEMHETFCYWSFPDWQRAVTDAGFTIHPASNAFTNPWIVQNRFVGKAALLRRGPDGALEPMEYPVTNMLLIAERS